MIPQKYRIKKEKRWDADRKEIKEFLTRQNGEDKGLLIEPKNLKIKVR